MKTNRLLKKQFNEANKFELEKQVIPPLAFIGFLISLIGFFVNFLIHLIAQVSVVTGVAFISYLIIYFISKKEKYYTFSKWFLLIFTILLFNLLWYFNFGSHGPAPYVFILIYSFFILIFKKNEAIVLSIIIGINLLLLFILEYGNPKIVGDYATDQGRIIDVFSALIYYGLAFYVFLSIVKKSYYSEYKKAKESDRLKTSFLANMSHEIRTPLNAIVGFSNLLAEGDLNEGEKEQYVSIINQSNKSLLRLIDDILDVSLIEAEQLKIVPVEICVNDLLDNLEVTYKKVLHEMKKTEVQLIKQSATEKIYATTDAARINQVMINLLDNAIKFTNKGQISFGFSLEDNFLNFFVADTGIGIQSEYSEVLFDRFFKLEKDKDILYRGTGIGLYLSRKIVELMGGHIGFESVYGEGSTFHFTISAKDIHNETNKTMEVIDMDKYTKNFQGASILVIEDEESSMLYLNRLLGKKGLKILEATTGREALSVFRANPNIDLVLLDVGLPDISGFVVLEEIKKINPKVVVMAETAFALAGDEGKCYKAGFDDYVAKPIPKDVLLEKISSLLGKPSQ